MIPEKAIVLHGLTGVGKTEVLKIMKNKGYPILDLEEMAGIGGQFLEPLDLARVIIKKRLIPFYLRDFTIFKPPATF